MIFPDARERVPTPHLDDEKVDLLRRRAYRPAFVESEKRPEFDFSFLRPPGWDVGPPALSPSAELPFPSLCSITRKAPRAALEILVWEAPHDYLPGDVLDCMFDALGLPQRSEGLVAHGWYAERMGEREHGYELMAATRMGKDIFLFLCAMPKDAVQKCRDEVNAMLASFGLKKPRAIPYAERWSMHDDEVLGLSFAAPSQARNTKAAGGTRVSWNIEGGPVELSIRPSGKNEQCLDDAEKALRNEAKRLGYTLMNEGRGGDMPAADGGVLSGDVVIRLYQSEPNSKKKGEAMLVLGRRGDGTQLRIAGLWPAREAHRVAWMRARFALVQAVTTLRATRR